MAIDLTKMKQKLDDIKSGGKGKDFWKPEIGTQVIRLLPTEDGDPFKSYFFHYNIGKETILCPKANFGEHCPACDFVSKLFNEKDDESVAMAKNIMKKQRFFSAVLVRGKEKEGPKVWGYSKTIYEYFIKAVLDPDYGDITDPDQGVDITIEYAKKESKSFPDTEPTLKRKSTPLCKDMTKEECKELLEKIPDFNSLHKKKTSAEVQAALDAFLQADDTVEASDDVKNEKVSKTDDDISSIDAALASLND